MSNGEPLWVVGQSVERNLPQLSSLGIRGVKVLLTEEVGGVGAGAQRLLTCRELGVSVEMPLDNETQQSGARKVSRTWVSCVS